MQHGEFAKSVDFECITSARYSTERQDNRQQGADQLKGLLGGGSSGVQCASKRQTLVCLPGAGDLSCSAVSPSGSHFHKCRHLVPDTIEFLKLHLP